VEISQVEMQSGGEVYARAFAQGWLPEPRLTVSQWADENRVLGTRAGRAALRWSTETTPYLREIMDSLGPRDPAKRVVVEAGSQIGKTETGNNWLGYLIDRSPGGILVVRPTVDEARRFSRQRLDPMIDATPSLSRLVRPARSRDSGNTMLLKEFPGGILMLAGSNSTTGLKSMPIRYLFADEIDEYPGDVDGQGDPISLAEKRLAGPTWSRRKELLVSTPTIKGLSAIEREFLKSDQRHYFVPCPECGHYDWIRWENIRWTPEEPETAALVCVECGVLIDERHKRTMLPAGEWRATAEGDGETIGFHISSLYSPLGWFPWSAAVEEFLAAKDEPMKLKTWVNTVLGETWEERGDSVDATALLERRESYSAEVPEGVGILVGAIDVQDDRVEIQVKGYGAAEESWLIAYEAIYGEPGSEEFWLEVDRFLLQSFQHESGREIPISCVAVDSGGHHTEQVYRFAAARLGRRVFAVRGTGDEGKPLVGKPSKSNRYRVNLFNLCVDTGKATVYSRLRILTPGPGYVHLPEFVDEEYIDQLTAERAVRKWKQGRGSVRVWIKTRERNEALDLEVYCLAALYILGPGVVRSLPERAAELSKPPTDGENEGPARRAPRRRSGWMGGV
jgi:phage terminase large subunit GpA-like protein